MIDIDWKKDYHGEFVCPKCNSLGMVPQGIHKLNNKKQFFCKHCRKFLSDSINIDIKAVQDPLNDSVIWYTNYRIKYFVCPKCEDNNMYFSYINKHNKKIFLCKSCKTRIYDYINLKFSNYSKYSNDSPPLKPFVFQDDEWDLRSLIMEFSEYEIFDANINFKAFELDWFKQLVKKYIHFLCKTGKTTSFGAIAIHVSGLRSFSTYLTQIKVEGFNEINRSLMLDYYNYKKKLNKSLLGSLRDFYRTGNIQGWFTVDRNIIQDRDYPKVRRGNPDPISDVVREQIERNLHLLPEPIARMWIIVFFTAMRPNELALLKKDCLVQEGSHWKVVWQRKKVNDYHELPISRTIAKVIQEQQ